MSQTTKESRWKDFEALKAELMPVVRELGRMPTFRELRYAPKGLAHAIAAYHGGIVRTAAALGLVPSRKPAGYWKNPYNSAHELAEALKKNPIPGMEDLGDRIQGRRSGRKRRG